MEMKKIIIVGALFGSAALLTGCGLENIAGKENQDVVTYDVKDKVSEIEVNSPSGDIVLTESDRDGIRVTETLHWRGDNKPIPEHPVSGSGVTLRYDCNDEIGFQSCSIDYKVEVPKGLKVKVETGSGQITLRAVTNELTANTGSGDIEASGLSAKNAFAETGAGNVRLAFSGAPDDVEVRTGSGDASVKVPDGTYAVSTDTGSGDQSVEVKDDDSAPRKVSVETGSGDASVLKS
jgi:hypothetical protein